MIKPGGISDYCLGRVGRRKGKWHPQGRHTGWWGPQAQNAALRFCVLAEPAREVLGLPGQQPPANPQPPPHQCERLAQTSQATRKMWLALNLPGGWQGLWLLSLFTWGTQIELTLRD